MPNRWLPITVLTLLVIGLGYAIVSISVGEKGPHPIQITGTGDVQELVGGIHQLDDRLGDDDAEISMTLFQDVQCPRCADFQADVIDPLIDELRSHRRGPDRTSGTSRSALKPVTLGAIAVEAAAEQDHGWQYAELFMRNLDEVPEAGVNQDYLDQVASVTPKMDTAAWEEAYRQRLAGQRRVRERPGGRRPGHGPAAAGRSDPRNRELRHRGLGDARGRAQSRGRRGRDRAASLSRSRLPYSPLLGAWRSLVARTVRVGEVLGSNPSAPIFPPSDPASGARMRAL